MSSSHDIPKMLTRLWEHISQRRRRQFLLIIVSMLFSACAEIVSIGAVVPFLGVLTAQEVVFQNKTVQALAALISITSPDQLLLPLTILFIFAAVSAGIMRLIMLWAITRFSYATGADLSLSIYKRTLFQPYEVHVSRNSSEVISGIVTKANVTISSILTPTLTIMSSVILMTMIMAALIAVDPLVASISMLAFGSLYIAIAYISRRQLLRDSWRVAAGSTEIVKSLQEGLGGIRDVLIDNSQDVYCENYRKADQMLRRAQGNNTFIGQSPRFVMEALGMAMIGLLAFGLAQEDGGLDKAIPVLGALALGAQRLLPVLQQAYAALTLMRAGQIPLRDTLELLDQELPAHVIAPASQPLGFEEKISLSEVSFRYGPDLPWVLKDCSLDIERGSVVGFVGETGCGKSTLTDLVMGLLLPTKGYITIDGIPVTELNRRACQMHIAHVPQDIFLSDSTVYENIAFGVPENQIDRARVMEAARKAQIHEVVEGLAEGYETVVGERGVKLSGGQRQRLGIARALYKRANVIVFDEATSALDTETEDLVMKSIEGLQSEVTVLLIAHRISTLKNCTKIVELKGGIIAQVTNYDHFISGLRTLHAAD